MSDELKVNMRFQAGKTVEKRNKERHLIGRYCITHEVSVPQNDDKYVVIQRIEFQDLLTKRPNGEVQFRFCYYMREKNNLTGAKRWLFGQSAPFIPPEILTKLLNEAKTHIPGFKDSLQ